MNKVNDWSFTVNRARAKRARRGENTSENLDDVPLDDAAMADEAEFEQISKENDVRAGAAAADDAAVAYDENCALFRCCGRVVRLVDVWL